MMEGLSSSIYVAVLTPPKCKTNLLDAQVQGETDSEALLLLTGFVVRIDQRQPVFLLDFRYLDLITIIMVLGLVELIRI